MIVRGMFRSESAFAERLRRDRQKDAKGVRPSVWLDAWKADGANDECATVPIPQLTSPAQSRSVLGRWLAADESNVRDGFVRAENFGKRASLNRPPNRRCGS